MPTAEQIAKYAMPYDIDSGCPAPDPGGKFAYTVLEAEEEDARPTVPKQTEPREQRKFADGEPRREGLSQPAWGLYLNGNCGSLWGRFTNRPISAG